MLDPIKKTTTPHRSLSPVEQARAEWIAVDKKIKSLQFLINAYEISEDFPEDMKVRHIRDIKEDLGKAIEEKDEAGKALEKKLQEERTT